MSTRVAPARDRRREQPGAEQGAARRSGCRGPGGGFGCRTPQRGGFRREPGHASTGMRSRPHVSNRVTRPQPRAGLPSLGVGDSVPKGPVRIPREASRNGGSRADRGVPGRVRGMSCLANRGQGGLPSGGGDQNRSHRALGPGPLSPALPFKAARGCSLVAGSEKTAAESVLIQPLASR